MKKILVMNFFPAFTPPTSGGELRYFNLYNDLSMYCDITLLSPTYNDKEVELIEHSKNFREYRIPKEDIHNQLHWKLEKEGFASEFSALTCAYSGNYPNKYHEYYIKLYDSVDIIIHESPYMLNYDLFFGFDNKPRVYNSYNIEYKLLKQLYKGENGKRHLQYIYDLEKTLVSKSDIVFAVSDTERDGFSNFYGVDKNKIYIAPNGISPDLYVKDKTKTKRKTALFFGSAHPPNVEAVKFIVDKLADKCLDIEFLVAGTCCKGIKDTRTNVKLLGKVSEKEKEKLFETSDIAINPMFSGAGTNLKILEYLSAGLPTVSTAIGSRGINIVDEEHYLLADAANFVEKINFLVSRQDMKEKFSTKSKTFINNKYSWKSISQNVYSRLKDLHSEKRKSILVLNDFEVSSPFGGGEIRINRLYRELSKHFNIVLLCLNNTNQIKKTFITKTFLEISIPKTKEHIDEEKRVNSQYWVSASDIVTSYMAIKNLLYRKLSHHLMANLDITVLLHPYMYRIAQNINCKYLIHESLNCEMLLKTDMLLEHPSHKTLLEETKKVELGSCVDSKLIVSVSDDDHKDLIKCNNISKSKIHTIKNGVDFVDKKELNISFYKIKSIFKSCPTVVFIGSAHMPNIEALNYIINTLSYKLKSFYFIVIGTVCDTVDKNKLPNNVLLFGKLDEIYKNTLLNIADIAINPMFSGSGSNLKLAEYFSWKLPTVTTLFGARGYDIENNNDAIVSNIEDFEKNILKLHKERGFAKKLAYNGYKYAKKHLDWKVLADRYRLLLEKEVCSSTRKKLLIITYRFTIPPLGGAESYLYEIIKTLDELGNFDITVCYIDTYDIENLYHFSTKITPNTQEVDEKDFKNTRFIKFSADELEDGEKFKNSCLLMSNWMMEFRQTARKFTKFYQKHILLGGWHLAEKQNDTYRIWSSEESDIYLSDSTSFELNGYSPSGKIVTFYLDGFQILTQKVNNNFSINIDISHSGVLTFKTSKTNIDKDIRTLGLYISAIKCDGKDISLQYTYKEYMKKYHLKTYVKELIDTASARSEEIENIFQETRGVSSYALERYLEKNISCYDIALGHSIPFKTTVITSKYANKYDIPYALLPHVHYDDEFYHWKSYYTALQKAASVFVFPHNSIVNFYNQLNIKAVEVAGGGINISEYNNIQSGIEKIYNSSKPYFLVLGRKSRAKNYGSIIEAIDKINQKKHICNLLMIGRDEDNVKITSKYTKYIGEQSRENVLLALQHSIGLINMSESESFGIVMLEAWMYKKPVIVNKNCPAFTELIDNFENGILSDEVELQKNILHILCNQKDNLFMGNNGYKKTQKYKWEEIGKILNEILLGETT